MADDEQFSLCWNNFNSNLSAGFHESLCRGDLVDVTLAAEGQFVKAHRLVLSVCSPYFRKMFTQMPANQHAFVFLKDVSHSALKDLIQFMYCGEVNVKQEALPAFISTAEALQIKGLTDSDPAPSQSPAKPSTPAPQSAPPAQTITQALTSPRVRQRSSTSRSYRIETDDSDDKTTQIVLQATTAIPQQTQPTIVQQTSTTTAVVNQKRTAPRSISTPHTKRVKNSADPLEASEPTQIAVQTVTESKSTSEAEFIDLPIEMPTKSEPDYTEESGEVETAEQDATYVEDDSYGDMKYDESYFTENEEAGAATGGAGGATTSTAVVKQSFVDNSYVEQADQSASEAQGIKRNVKRGRPKRNPIVLGSTLAEKLESALQKKAQNAVYVSTTKGGMKILFEGHHFKYIFRRGACSIFQCCYKENMEQCMARVIITQNRVYPLDGEHNHFNQAMDKSVTSVMFEATPDDFDCGSSETEKENNAKSKKLSECDQFAEDVIEISESIGDLDVILPVNQSSMSNDDQKPAVVVEHIREELTTKDNENKSIAADDFREKIKKRLQKALLGKRK